MIKETIKISPITRLSRSLDLEMNLDENGIYGLGTYEKFLERQAHAEAKVHQMTKALYFNDALLFFLISGQNWSIPGLDIGVSAIPAIQEILLFASALSFFVLCTAFLTNQCYVAVVDTYGNRIVNSNIMDPDFFNASQKNYDFFLKIFRPKLNIWGSDFFQHRKPFAIFAGVMNSVIVLTILTIPAAHVALVVAGSISVFGGELGDFTKYFVVGCISAINLSALILVISAYIEFKFDMLQDGDVDGEEAKD